MESDVAALAMDLVFLSIGAFLHPGHGLVLIPGFVDFGPTCFMGIDTYINIEI